MIETRSGYSHLGIASFVLSFFPAVFLVGMNALSQYLINLQPPEADTVAYAFGMFVLAVLTTLSEIAALGLGIAGVLQRRCRRLFAFVGVACSILVVAVINSQIGLVDLVLFFWSLFTEPQPKVHSVSP